MIPTVRLIPSCEWLYDRLLKDATPPTEYRWAQVDNEVADLAIFLVPFDIERDSRARLSSLGLLEYRRLYLFSQADYAIPWAPGLFTSLRRCDAGPEFGGGFYILPGYFEDPTGFGQLIEQSTCEPDLLWSFVGSVENCPAVRTRIMGLQDRRAISADTRVWREVRWLHDGKGEEQRLASIARYVRSVQRSKFVVAPRGRGPSSIRLFETMQAGRVPVIVSDDWLPPRLIDWDSCSLRVAESDVERIPMILREREHDAEELGRQARATWEANFSPRTMVHHIVSSCLALHEFGATVPHRLRLSASSLPSRPFLRRARQVARAEWSGRQRFPARSG